MECVALLGQCVGPPENTCDLRLTWPDERVRSAEQAQRRVRVRRRASNWLQSFQKKYWNILQRHTMPRVAGRAPSQAFGAVLFRCLVVGGFLGVLSSLMVNSSLVEVSCSPFFAVSFGLLFLTSGAMMAAQIIMTGSAVKNKALLIFFSLANLAASITCFFLERDWSHGLTPKKKIPLYCLLGSCLAFSVNFSSLDLLARFECFSSSQLLVRAEWQVRVVAITSICTGCLYGLTFGVLDVEDAITKSPASCAPRLCASNPRSLNLHCI